jgi:hypothetical protein
VLRDPLLLVKVTSLEFVLERAQVKGGEQIALLTLANGPYGSGLEKHLDAPKCLEMMLQDYWGLSHGGRIRNRHKTESLLIGGR